jgi:regulator of sirC expression with transglutaminase-like and TPR domain
MTDLKSEFSGYNIKILAVAFLVALLTLLVYLPALQNGFVNWDDHKYVYENPYIQSIDFKLLKWMFTTFRAANWHPLTWLSHALDYAIWGLNPLGHHLTNIILHALNTFLVVLISIRLVNYADSTLPFLTKGNPSIIAGAVTGLLFGIHPIHVESVAWVSERKDVLYAFFFLLSILSYLKYTSSQRQEFSRHPSVVTRHWWYSLCLIFFVLSLMSKPMAVTLPVVLILLDIYPLERLHLKSAFISQRKVLIEKLPFLIFSIASSVITIIAQQAGRSVVPLWAYPFEDRLWIAIKAPCFYLFKIVWPTDLVPLYPFPIHLSLNFEYIGSLFLIIIISIFCIWVWHMRQRFWLAIWVYYIITLFPVLGLIQVGGHAAADRYMYLPSIGPFLLFGLGISWVWEKIYIRDTNSIIKKLFISAPLIILLCFLSILTVRQEAIWKDSISLWDAELSQFPKLHVIYNNRAEAYMRLGNYQKAIDDYKKAIEVNPRNSIAYYNRGLAYGKSGLHHKAIGDFNRAIKLDPQNTKFYINLGIAYGNLGNYQQAIEKFNVAIKFAVELDPVLKKAYYNRGIAYKKLGDDKQANRDFQIAARLGSKQSQDYLKSKGIGW